VVQRGPRSPREASPREASPRVASPREAGPREARRRQRIELSREQILDTAEELFAERGYHSTSLKDVAERCEFSVGSIYQFFESKDALYEEVLMRRGPELSEEMVRVAASGAPADEQLLALAQLQVSHFRKYPAWGRLSTRVLTPGMRPATGVPASYLAAFQAAIDLEARLFARGQRAGVLRDGDPRALARLFSSLVSAFHAMDEVGDQPEDFSAEDFLSVITRAFIVGH
jgi:AcrR family transcriptional regulator